MLFLSLFRSSVPDCATLRAIAPALVPLFSPSYPSLGGATSLRHCRGVCNFFYSFSRSYFAPPGGVTAFLVAGSAIRAIIRCFFQRIVFSFGVGITDSLVWFGNLPEVSFITWATFVCPFFLLRLLQTWRNASLCRKERPV